MAVKTTKKTAVKGVKKTISGSRSKLKPGSGVKNSVGGGSSKVKEKADNELKKMIIALGKTVDRTSKTVDRTSKTVDRTSKTVDRLGEKIDRSCEKIDKAILSMTASIAESDAKIAASDAKIAASNAKMAASSAHLDLVVEGTKAELAGLSQSAGRTAENLAVDFFDKRMTFAGVRFDEVDRGIARRKKLPDGRRIEGEYDVVLYNGTAIALVEVKTRVRMEDIDKLINEQMPRFKLFFPQYKDFKYYLGLCGMSFEEGVEETALGKGIGTIKPSGDTLEINEANVKAW